MSTNNNIIRVSCALLMKDSHIFAAKRAPNKSMPGLWEFPGGKVESGETIEDSIIREMREELDLEVVTSQVCQSFFHHYDEFEIELIPVICELHDVEFSLNEHTLAGWFDEESARELEWCPADKPVLEFALKIIREEK